MGLVFPQPSHHAALGDSYGDSYGGTTFTPRVGLVDRASDTAARLAALIAAEQRRQKQGVLDALKAALATANAYRQTIYGARQRLDQVRAHPVLAAIAPESAEVQTLLADADAISQLLGAEVERVDAWRREQTKRITSAERELGIRNR